MQNERPVRERHQQLRLSHAIARAGGRYKGEVTGGHIYVLVPPKGEGWDRSWLPQPAYCGIPVACYSWRSRNSIAVGFQRSNAMAYPPASTSIFARGPAIPTTAAIPWAPLAGRILLSTIFILSGLTKFTDWQGTAAYMAAHGLPLIPVLLPLAAIVEMAGGLAILLGSKSRLAALVLFV